MGCPTKYSLSCTLVKYTRETFRAICRRCTSRLSGIC
ncbi:unnamed protein product [Trichobilharzia regenti]|nr:unnamed protein product [Trichobilharzia regenti]